MENKIDYKTLNYVLVSVVILCVCYSIIMVARGGANFASLMCFGGCVVAVCSMILTYYKYSVSRKLDTLPCEREIRKRIFHVLKQKGCSPEYVPEHNAIVTTYQGCKFGIEFDNIRVRAILPDWSKFKADAVDTMAMLSAIDCINNRIGVVVRDFRSNEDEYIHLYSIIYFDVFNSIPHFADFVTSKLDALIASRSMLGDAYAAFVGGGRSAEGSRPVGFATATDDEQPAAGVRAATECHTDVS